MDDRRTKAQILVELANAQDAYRATAKELDAVKASIPEPPKRAPEATALDTCIRALAAIRPNGSTSPYARPDDMVPWVIGALADRYGVPRTTTICDRPHLEEF